MKHENEPEDAADGMCMCNFCDELYDPYDRHTCKGNDIPPRLSRKVVEEEEGAHGGSPAKALTYDTGKPPLAWLPWAAVKAMNRVQQYGHSKYKDFNNYRKGMEVSRNLSCALRHIEEYLEGHDVDVESGESPLAHAMCRIAFVLQNMHEGKAIDDRYKP